MQLRGKKRDSKLGVIVGNIKISLLLCNTTSYRIRYILINLGVLGAILEKK